MPPHPLRQRPTDGSPSPRVPIRWIACGLATFVFATFATADGPITFGENHVDSISQGGEVDLWTFEAEAGDSVLIIISESIPEGMSDTDFRPNINLSDPDDQLISFTNGAIGSRLNERLEKDGTYTIRVSDLPDVETGDYQLRVAKTPGDFTTPDGDEGGTLENGANQLGAIDIGDLDIWRFTAEAGDHFTLSIAREVPENTDFSPTMWLYAPDGAFLFSYNAASDPATETSQVAEQDGAYTVVISDFIGDAPGAYTLRLAQLSQTFTIPEGDEGTILVNGENHTGVLEIGDLDLWTFEAVVGDNIFLSIAELASSSEELTDFSPQIRVYDPNGDETGNRGGPISRTFNQTVAISGTYTVLVTDDHEHHPGSYILRLARTPQAFLVPDGDEGGPLPNGLPQYGSIAWGDLDLWTFDANEGETIVLSIAEQPDGEDQLTDFRPRIRLLDPDGVEVRDNSAEIGAQALKQAEKTGTYTVLVSDAVDDNAKIPGHYRLELALIPAAYQISEGDQGGALANGETRLGTISVGDLDLYQLRVVDSDFVTIRLDEVIQAGDSGDFSPNLRVFDETGTLLNDLTDESSLEWTRTNRGTRTYFALVSDGDEDKAGSYQIRYLSLPAKLELNPIRTVKQTQAVSIPLSATDPNDPDSPVAFAIESGGLDGMEIQSLSATEAELIWTAPEGFEPQTAQIVVSASTDFEGQTYSDTRTVFLTIQKHETIIDIASYSLDPGKSLAIHYAGEDAKSYQLLRSSDLSQWEVVETFQGTRQIEIDLEELETGGSVFYRVVETQE
ncbi:hypothetical protein [Pelagicoccus sp. SDUM812003]|uniref:hypothetical protein n=1 Tax=Pelagicoccus sp. SDUM812003 TaxID=3041267 RepID=UPI00280F9F0D|nr:hypothetical protein [Pelagicoccus sp. SDUM812003]MDQ8203750.1 hypothetical protein [Pelagicoccus sp. SDUM812003]